MKKFFYSVLAAATMLLATTSCSQEEEFVGGGSVDNGTTQKVTFTVQLPGDDAASRAIADGVEVGKGNMADKLIWALYETGKTEGDPLDTGTGEKLGDKEFTAKIDMVKGLSYEVLFLAYNQEAPAFDVEEGDDLKSLTLNTGTGLKANKESYDAFVARHTHEVGVAAVTTVELYRPFAQINVGTTQEDLDKAAKLQAVVTESEMVIKKVPTRYNILNGVADEKQDVSYGKSSILTNVDAAEGTHPNEEIKELGLDKSYYYLNMAYVLADKIDETKNDGKGEPSIHTATFKFYRDNDTNPVHTFTVPNLPIQRNYRTNVLGDLLTQTENFRIVIKEAFMGDINVHQWDGKSVAKPAYDEETKTWTVVTAAEMAWIAGATNGTLPEDARSITYPHSFSGETVKLVNDLDMAGHEWTPIGNSTVEAFKGTFDGCGHTIKNITITKSNDAKAAAFFGVLSGNASINNLVIDNAQITCNVTSGETNFYGAGLAAVVYGEHTFESIIVKNSKIQGSGKTGGLIGFNGDCAQVVTNCKVINSTIESTNPEDGGNIGGLIGFLQSVGGRGTSHEFIITNSSVENCVVKAYNVPNAGKRANSKFIGGFKSDDKKEWSLIINGCTIVETTLNQPETVTFQSPFGEFVGGERNDATAKVIVDGYLMIANGLSMKNGIYYVSNSNGLLNVFADYNDVEVKLQSDFDVEEIIAVGNNKQFILDLNGKTITGTDKTEMNFSILDNRGNLTIKNTATNAGKLTLKATTNNGWSRYSAVLANNPGGNLTVEAGVVIEHLGGTDMAYGIDNLTNGKGTSAIVTIDGATVMSPYRAIRQFLNGVEAANELYINSGVIEGDNKSVWMQDPGKNANTGKLVVASEAQLKGDVYLSVTEGSAEWPVEVSIAAAALVDGYNVFTSEFVPDGYQLVEVDGTYMVGNATNADALIEALEKGSDVIFTTDIKIDPAGMSNAYGTTGINVTNGQTINGNGNTLDIKGAGGTWDSGINTTGGLIKNLTVTGSFRGIFINHNSDHNEPVILENVIIDGTTYTISCDQGNNQTLKATDCTFKGWTSYAATLGSAEFIGCHFGEGNGYAYCRPYAPTAFVNCEFEAGFELDARAAVTFENCKIGGVALTAENLATLVTSNIANATVK